MVRMWIQMHIRIIHRLVNGPLKGAVVQHSGVPENSPLTLMGCFSTLMGCFPECRNGPFSLSKIPWEQPMEKRGIKRFLIYGFASCEANAPQNVQKKTLRSEGPPAFRDTTILTKNSFTDRLKNTGDFV